MPLYKIPQDFKSSPKILHKCCTDACAKFYPSAFPNPSSLIGPAPHLRKVEHERRGYTQEEFTERLVNMTEQVLDGSKESTLHCATFFGMEENQLEPYVNAAFLYFCVEKEKERFDCDEGQTSSNRERQRNASGKMMSKRRHWLDYPHFLFEAITAEMKNHEFKGSSEFRQVPMFRAVSEYIIHGMGMQPLAKHYMVDQYLLHKIIKCCVAKLVFCLGEEGALNERIDMIINKGKGGFIQKFNSIQSIKGQMSPISSTPTPSKSATQMTEAEQQDSPSPQSSFGRKRSRTVAVDDVFARSRSRTAAIRKQLLEEEENEEVNNNIENYPEKNIGKVDGEKQCATETGAVKELKAKKKGTAAATKGTTRGRKRKTTESDQADGANSSDFKVPEKRSRGRPTGSRSRSKSVTTPAPVLQADRSLSVAPTLLLTTTPRKRGRPPKNKNSNEERDVVEKDGKQLLNRAKSMRASTTIKRQTHVNKNLQRTSSQVFYMPNKRQPSMLCSEEWLNPLELHEELETPRDAAIDSMQHDPLFSEMLTIEKAAMEEAMGPHCQPNEQENLLVRNGRHTLTVQSRRELKAEWLTKRSFWDRCIPAIRASFIVQEQDLKEEYYKRCNEKKEASSLMSHQESVSQPVPISKKEEIVESSGRPATNTKFAGYSAKELMDELFLPMGPPESNLPPWFTIFELRFRIFAILLNGYKAYPEPMLSALTEFLVFDPPIPKLAADHGIKTDVLLKAITMISRFIDVGRLRIVPDDSSWQQSLCEEMQLAFESGPSTSAHK